MSGPVSSGFPGGRLRGAAAGVAAAVLLAGCSLGDDAPRRASPTAVRSTAEPTPTGTGETPSTTAATPAPGPAGLGPDGVDITRPPAGVAATGPVVVLVHGGFWVGGSPGNMAQWAEALAAAGAVVFNSSYRLVYQGGGYPATLDDIACTVRYARAQAPDLTTSDELVLMGHSAGGHLAAVVALNGDAFGADCPYPAAAPADRLIGLAGVYDVRAFGSVFGVFVGASQAADPARWEAVNPVQLVDRRRDLATLLIVGADDELIRPADAEAFAAALPPNEVALEVVPGAAHNDLLVPDVVGLARLRLFD